MKMIWTLKPEYSSHHFIQKLFPVCRQKDSSKLTPAPEFPKLAIQFPAIVPTPEACFRA